MLRTYGVCRVGTIGVAWRRVEVLVDEFAPVTPADWATLAAWVLDGDVAELVVVRRRRNRRLIPAPQRVEMTRVEVLAARSA